MYGKILNVMQKKRVNNTQNRSGSDLNKEKKSNGHERRKHEQQIEQKQ